MTQEHNPGPGKSVVRRAQKSFAVENLFLRKQLCIWPVLAAVLLLVIGLWVRSQVEESQKADLKDDLTSILNADVEALEIWMKSQRSNATSAADALLIRGLARELLALAAKDGTTALDLASSPKQ